MPGTPSDKRSTSGTVIANSDGSCSDQPLLFSSTISQGCLTSIDKNGNNGDEYGADFDNENENDNEVRDILDHQNIGQSRNVDINTATTTATNLTNTTNGDNGYDNYDNDNENIDSEELTDNDDYTANDLQYLAAAGDLPQLQDPALTKKLSRSIASSIIGGSSINDRDELDFEEDYEDDLAEQEKVRIQKKNEQQIKPPKRTFTSKLRSMNIGSAADDTPAPDSQKIFSFSLPFGESLMNFLPSVKLPKLKFFNNDSSIRFITTQNYDKHELKKKLKRNNSLSTLEEAYLYKDFKGADNSRLRAVRKALTPNIAKDMAHYLNEKKSAIKSSNLLPYNSNSNSHSDVSSISSSTRSSTLPAQNGTNVPSEIVRQRIKDRIYYSETVFNQLEGDIVILGGYRGSILRDKETNRRVWIPIKVGLNLRKVDLVVGPQDSDELEMEDKIYADGMLKNVGPIDIAKKLIKKLRAVPNTRVYEFGYDWRLSSDINAAKLKKFLETLPGNMNKDPSKRKGALVLAHSMGGLLAHHTMNQDPTLFNGLVYLGAPYECLNILGPIRFGDSVLFSKTVLTAEANFLMRSSFVFLPRHGKVFYDKITGKFIELDLFDPDTWVKYNLSPLVVHNRKIEAEEQEHNHHQNFNLDKQKQLQSQHNYQEDGRDTSANESTTDMINVGVSNLSIISPRSHPNLTQLGNGSANGNSNANGNGTAHQYRNLVDSPVGTRQISDIHNVTTLTTGNSNNNANINGNSASNSNSGSLLRLSPLFTSHTIRADAIKKSISNNIQKRSNSLSFKDRDKDSSFFTSNSNNTSTASSIHNKIIGGTNVNTTNNLNVIAPSVASPAFQMSFNEAYSYLSRTLKRTHKFVKELEYDSRNETNYPPLAIVYGNTVPSVRGVFVDGEKDIMEGNYGDFFYGPGDGVIHQKWLMPENIEGFEKHIVGKVASECGHVSLMTDIEAVGRALSSVIAQKKNADK